MLVDVRDRDSASSAEKDPRLAETSPWTTGLFAATSLLGAALLFVVQPLVARLVLPHFGGSATVWSTSSLFFQVLLLLGYVYAHLSTVGLGRRRQPMMHLAVLLLPLVALPVALPDNLRPDPSASPIAWLLLTLAMTIGLPFAVISTTGPLLQRWYSWTNSRRADDPYFLFATSNLGSFGGLLAYPFIVEPLLTVDQQRVWWSWGFVGFLVLMGTCAAVARQSNRTEGPSQQRSSSVAAPRQADPAPPTPVTGRTVAAWLGLSFLPSTLMLGVTAHISTDVAAIPLMWVVPLAIYLATFVVAFARKSRVVPLGWSRASGLFALGAGVLWVLGGGVHMGIAIVVDLGLLVTAAFAAHARLATMRPDPAHLTFFYLVVAAGGALGGLLNGVIAPLAFNWVWEYPLAVVAAALLGIGHSLPVSRLIARRYHPAFVILVEGCLGLLAAVFAGWALARQGGGVLLTVAVVVIALVIGWLVSRRPVSAALAVAVLVVLPAVLGDPVILRERSFYGSYTVREADGVRTFTHGTTLHGEQALGDSALTPLSYYAKSGPVGSMFETVEDPESIGVVGLGVGTLAAYGRPGQSMTFFEIDPLVVSVATDPNLFTFLSESKADIGHVVGDGRLTLAERPPGSLDVLVLDAFSSDAIPVHLLTAEAFDGYARVLREGGLLMVHISNRVFDLEPVVAAGADRLGWQAAVAVDDGSVESGKVPTRYVALSSDTDVIDRLIAHDAMWRLPTDRRVRWTDDFASVLRVLG